MASAEDYANWIVSNQDKKGTPEFDTVAQAYKVARGQSSQTKPPSEMNWKEVGESAWQNLPKSVGNVIGGVAEAVAHPIDTLQNVGNLAVGAYSKALPESVSKFLKEKSSPQAQTNIAEAEKVAAALGQEYAKKYGTMEGFKEAVATDPAGVMADVSTVLTGGGAAASKVPALAKTGQVLSKAGSYTDPLANALRATGKAYDIGASGAKKLVGMTSGVGEDALSQAYKAGQSGGQRGATFLENMRGESEMTDVLEAAKANLQEMGRQKQRDYRANMASVKSDKSVLDFTGIDKSLVDAEKYSSYKGQTLNQAAADALGEIKATVDKWKTLDPAEFHTPEGMDALKQAIWDSMEKIPDNSKRAQTAAKEVYNSVKSEISKQAPEYSKAMKEYTDASDQIKEIERALSLGNKAAADTSMRKLQSLMRNNANTNYGYRMKLAEQLEQAGGRELMPALAGQALSQWTPRGIQRAAAGPSALVAYGTGGLPLAAADLAVSSPRLMGEVAYKGGQLSSALRGAAQKAQAPLNAANIDPRILANYLYQINPQGQQ
jgi:hypothetical protein